MNTKVVGMLGTGCSGTAASVALLARYMRVPMISKFATRLSLSDRAKYPGSWRTLTPDTFFEEAWLAVTKALGMSEVRVVTGNRADGSDAMAEPLVQVSNDIGVTTIPIPHMDFPGVGMLNFWELQ